MSCHLTSASFRTISTSKAFWTHFIHESLSILSENIGECLVFWCFHRYRKRPVAQNVLMKVILVEVAEVWLNSLFNRILANSANTKCRPFQVKINCSKFIIDRLQSWCYLTFLFSLFVTSRNLLFDVFLPWEKSRKYQASVSERCTFLSERSGMFRQNLLQVPLKNLNL